MPILLKFLLARIKEPSTWTALSVIAAMFGACRPARSRLRTKS